MVKKPKKLVSAKSIKAAYDLLKVTAFSDIKLPANVSFRASRMSRSWGLYFWPDNLMVINTDITTCEQLLKTVAHEMVHSAWEKEAATSSDHDLHDENFNQLAALICERMGWTGGV